MKHTAGPRVVEKLRMNLCVVIDGYMWNQKLFLFWGIKKEMKIMLNS